MAEYKPKTLSAAVADSGRSPCAFGIAMSKVPAKRWSTRSDLYDCLARARAFLEADPREPIRLPVLAAEVGESRHSISSACSRSFSERAHDFHRRLRMELSKRLIEEGMSGIEACYEVGFQSPSSFSRLFKRAFGVSPGKVKGTKS